MSYKQQESSETRYETENSGQILILNEWFEINWIVYVGILWWKIFIKTNHQNDCYIYINPFKVQSQCWNFGENFKNEI